MAGLQSLKENFRTVNDRIDKILDQSLRNHAGLKLVVVSKRQPLKVILDAYSLGSRDFGENQIQEGVPKIKACPSDITWHFIGHLQKNKVRKAVKYFQYIHSIDSLSLLKRVDNIAAEERLCPKVFLQVNYALDPDKHGLHPEAVQPVLEVARTMKSLSCIGLMGMPPLAADAGGVEDYFKGMARLRDQLREQWSDWPGKLSLGMSGDFEIAITAGSNFIRLGSILLGERH